MMVNKTMIAKKRDIYDSRVAFAAEEDCVVRKYFYDGDGIF